MLLLLKLLRSRLVLGGLGLLLVGLCGFWAGWRSHPVPAPVETVRTITKTVEHVVTVTQKPDGTVITSTEEREVATNTASSTSKAVPKSKYSIGAAAVKYDWTRFQPDAYYFDVSRRIGESNVSVTAGYLHANRPEVSLGVRLDL